MKLAAALTIDRRFNGPPASGNGGYVAGRLAEALGAAAVEVTLRAPPPLGRQLAIRSLESGGVALYDGDLLLAEAVAHHFDVAIPPLPTLEAAEAAGALGRLRAAARRATNPYARCFGCGIDRSDGLRIIPDGADMGGAPGLVAATWTPDPSLAPAGAAVPVPVVWAALDCPAGIAWSRQLPPGSPPAVTGRIAARVNLPLEVGERYLVLGWPIGRDGRKLHAGTAIVDATGRVRARSLQLWLLPRAAESSGRA